ncbi:filamentous hemagglutinin N-terminal domain-containing protein [Microvirgula aerodenitrificans]|uniref:filamentous hemagglutinin N-terminal domain-containing protein n=1 Tax=Microvirgula aerodenitrificans TaxID=57480 RepID=UPI00048C725E|nr:filamentous hemagglutinin N-terminal domain-containing protein [Microvirgula aerodenitrificans]
MTLPTHFPPLFLALLTPGTVLSAQADGIVADPGAASTQQPVVQRTASGLPQVDIQTPNAAGVSHNHYRQFDVGPRGAILNNARHDVQTELGGRVRGNPALASGSARLIINEVNSSQPSLLRGLLEVAGPRADVIVANPSGITCAGCGFINADRSTLSTGRPQPGPQGNLDSFRVSNGTVRIEGAGLYAGLSSHTAIFARAVEINAGLWARHLRVVTGANRISADGDTVTAEAADAATRPQFALDSALLGGMYAGKIFLTGTEHGVGVNLGGKVTAGDGGLVLHADGRLEVSGTVHSEGSARLHSHERLDNRGGILTARGNISLDGARLNNAGGRIESTAGALDMTARAGGIGNRAGRIKAAGRIVLTSDGIDNRGGTIAGQQLVIDARQATLDNRNGGLDAREDLSLNGSSHLGNRQGHIRAGGRLAIGTPSTPLRGIVNHDGELHAGRQLTIHADQFDGDGRLYSGGDFHLAVHGDLSHGGTLRAGGDATARVGGILLNLGRMETGRRLTLSSAHLANAGLLGGDVIRLSSTGRVENLGLIDGRRVHIGASRLSNDAGNSHAAMITARDRLDIGVQSLDNHPHARIFSAGDLLIGGGLDDNDHAGGRAGSVVNRGATFEALGRLILRATRLRNLRNRESGTSIPARILSGGPMLLDTGRLTNDDSLILANLADRPVIVPARPPAPEPTAPAPETTVPAPETAWVPAPPAPETAGGPAPPFPPWLHDRFRAQQEERERRAQLTGRRFDTSHHADEARYHARLAQTLLPAHDWQLIPGVVLSAMQMARLTGRVHPGLFSLGADGRIDLGTLPGRGRDAGASRRDRQEDGAPVFR